MPVSTRFVVLVISLLPFIREGESFVNCEDSLSRKKQDLIPWSEDPAQYNDILEISDDNQVQIENSKDQGLNEIFNRRSKKTLCKGHDSSKIFDTNRFLPFLLTSKLNEWRLNSSNNQKYIDKGDKYFKHASKLVSKEVHGPFKHQNGLGSPSVAVKTFTSFIKNNPKLLSHLVKKLFRSENEQSSLIKTDTNRCRSGFTGTKNRNIENEYTKDATECNRFYNPKHNDGTANEYIVNKHENDQVDAYIKEIEHIFNDVIEVLINKNKMDKVPPDKSKRHKKISKAGMILDGLNKHKLQNLTMNNEDVNLFLKVITQMLTLKQLQDELVGGQKLSSSRESFISTASHNLGSDTSTIPNFPDDTIENATIATHETTSTNNPIVTKKKTKIIKRNYDQICSDDKNNTLTVKSTNDELNSNDKYIHLDRILDEYTELLRYLSKNIFKDKDSKIEKIEKNDCKDKEMDYSNTHFLFSNVTDPNKLKISLLKNRMETKNLNRNRRNFYKSRSSKRNYINLFQDNVNVETFKSKTLKLESKNLNRDHNCDKYKNSIPHNDSMILANKRVYKKFQPSHFMGTEINYDDSYAYCPSTKTIIPSWEVRFAEPKFIPPFVPTETPCGDPITLPYTPYVDKSCESYIFRQKNKEIEKGPVKQHSDHLYDKTINDLEYLKNLMSEKDIEMTQRNLQVNIDGMVCKIDKAKNKPFLNSNTVLAKCETKTKSFKSNEAKLLDVLKNDSVEKRSNVNVLPNSFRNKMSKEMDSLSHEISGSTTIFNKGNKNKLSITEQNFESIETAPKIIMKPIFPVCLNLADSKTNDPNRSVSELSLFHHTTPGQEINKTTHVKGSDHHNSTTTPLVYVIQNFIHPSTTQEGLKPHDINNISKSIIQTTPASEFLNQLLKKELSKVKELFVPINQENLDNSIKVPMIMPEANKLLNARMDSSNFKIGCDLSGLVLQFDNTTLLSTSNSNMDRNPDLIITPLNDMKNVFNSNYNSDLLNEPKPLYLEPKASEKLYKDRMYHNKSIFDSNKNAIKFVRFPLAGLIAYATIINDNNPNNNFNMIKLINRVKRHSISKDLTNFRGIKLFSKAGYKINDKMTRDHEKKPTFFKFCFMKNKKDSINLTSSKTVLLPTITSNAVLKNDTTTATPVETSMFQNIIKMKSNNMNIKGSDKTLPLNKTIGFLKTLPAKEQKTSSEIIQKEILNPHTPNGHIKQINVNAISIHPDVNHQYPKQRGNHENLTKTEPKEICELIIYFPSNQKLSIKNQSFSMLEHNPNWELTPLNKLRKYTKDFCAGKSSSYLNYKDIFTINPLRCHIRPTSFPLTTKIKKHNKDQYVMEATVRSLGDKNTSKLDDPKFKIYNDPMLETKQAKTATLACFNTFSQHDYTPSSTHNTNIKGETSEASKLSDLCQTKCPDMLNPLTTLEGVNKFIGSTTQSSGTKNTETRDTMNLTVYRLLNTPTIMSYQWPEIPTQQQTLINTSKTSPEKRTESIINLSHTMTTTELQYLESETLLHKTKICNSQTQSMPTLNVTLSNLFNTTRRMSYKWPETATNQPGFATSNSENTSEPRTPTRIDKSHSMTTSKMLILESETHEGKLEETQNDESKTETGTRLHLTESDLFFTPTVISNPWQIQHTDQSVFINTGSKTTPKVETETVNLTNSLHNPEMIFRESDTDQKPKELISSTTQIPQTKSEAKDSLNATEIKKYNAPTIMTNRWLENSNKQLALINTITKNTLEPNPQISFNLSHLIITPNMSFLESETHKVLKELINSTTPSNKTETETRDKLDLTISNLFNASTIMSFHLPETSTKQQNLININHENLPEPRTETSVNLLHLISIPEISFLQPVTQKGMNQLIGCTTQNYKTNPKSKNNLNLTVSNLLKIPTIMSYRSLEKPTKHQAPKITDSNNTTETRTEAKTITPNKWTEIPTKQSTFINTNTIAEATDSSLHNRDQLDLGRKNDQIIQISGIKPQFKTLHIFLPQDIDNNTIIKPGVIYQSNFNLTISGSHQLIPVHSLKELEIKKQAITSLNDNSKSQMTVNQSNESLWNTKHNTILQNFNTTSSNKEYHVDIGADSQFRKKITHATSNMSFFPPFYNIYTVKSNGKTQSNHNFTLSEFQSSTLLTESFRGLTSYNTPDLEECNLVSETTNSIMDISTQAAKNSTNNYNSYSTNAEEGSSYICDRTIDSSTTDHNFNNEITYKSDHYPPYILETEDFYSSTELYYPDISKLTTSLESSQELVTKKISHLSALGPTLNNKNQINFSSEKGYRKSIAYESFTTKEEVLNTTQFSVVNKTFFTTVLANKNNGTQNIKINSNIKSPSTKKFNRIDGNVGNELVNNSTIKVNSTRSPIRLVLDSINMPFANEAKLQNISESNSDKSNSTIEQTEILTGHPNFNVTTHNSKTTIDYNSSLKTFEISNRIPEAEANSYTADSLKSRTLANDLRSISRHFYDCILRSSAIDRCNDSKEYNENVKFETNLKFENNISNENSESGMESTTEPLRLSGWNQNMNIIPTAAGLESASTSPTNYIKLHNKQNGDFTNFSPAERLTKNVTFVEEAKKEFDLKTNTEGIDPTKAIITRVEPHKMIKMAGNTQQGFSASNAKSCKKNKYFKPADVFGIGEKAKPESRGILKYINKSTEGNIHKIKFIKKHDSSNIVTVRKDALNNARYICTKQDTQDDTESKISDSLVDCTESKTTAMCTSNTNITTQESLRDKIAKFNDFLCKIGTTAIKNHLCTISSVDNKKLKNVTEILKNSTIETDKTVMLTTQHSCTHSQINSVSSDLKNKVTPKINLLELHVLLNTTDSDIPKLLEVTDIVNVNRIGTTSDEIITNLQVITLPSMTNTTNFKQRIDYMTQKPIKNLNKSNNINTFSALTTPYEKSFIEQFKNVNSETTTPTEREQTKVCFNQINFLEQTSINLHEKSTEPITDVKADKTNMELYEQPSKGKDLGQDKFYQGNQNNGFNRNNSKLIGHSFAESDQKLPINLSANVNSLPFQFVIPYPKLGDRIFRRSTLRWSLHDSNFFGTTDFLETTVNNTPSTLDQIYIQVPPSSGPIPFRLDEGGTTSVDTVNQTWKGMATIRMENEHGIVNDSTTFINITDTGTEDQEVSTNTIINIGEELESNLTNKRHLSTNKSTYLKVLKTSKTQNNETKTETLTTEHSCTYPPFSSINNHLKVVTLLYISNTINLEKRIDCTPLEPVENLKEFYKTNLRVTNDIFRTRDLKNENSIIILDNEQTDPCSIKITSTEQTVINSLRENDKGPSNTLDLDSSLQITTTALGSTNGGSINPVTTHRYSQQITSAKKHALGFFNYFRKHSSKGDAISQDNDGRVNQNNGSNAKRIGLSLVDSNIIFPNSIISNANFSLTELEDHIFRRSTSRWSLFNLTTIQTYSTVITEPPVRKGPLDQIDIDAPPKLDAREIDLFVNSTKSYSRMDTPTKKEKTQHFTSTTPSYKLSPTIVDVGPLPNSKLQSTNKVSSSIPADNVEKYSEFSNYSKDKISVIEELSLKTTNQINWKNIATDRMETLVKGIIGDFTPFVDVINTNTTDQELTSNIIPLNIPPTIKTPTHKNLKDNQKCGYKDSVIHIKLKIENKTPCEIKGIELNTGSKNSYAPPSKLFEANNVCVKNKMFEDLTLTANEVKSKVSTSVTSTQSAPHSDNVQLTNINKPNEILKLINTNNKLKETKINQNDIEEINRFYKDDDKVTTENTNLGGTEKSKYRQSDIFLKETNPNDVDKISDPEVEMDLGYNEGTTQATTNSLIDLKCLQMPNGYYFRTSLPLVLNRTEISTQEGYTDIETTRTFNKNNYLCGNSKQNKLLKSSSKQKYYRRRKRPEKIFIKERRSQNHYNQTFSGKSFLDIDDLKKNDGKKITSREGSRYNTSLADSNIRMILQQLKPCFRPDPTLTYYPRSVETDNNNHQSIDQIPKTTEIIHASEHLCYNPSEDENDGKFFGLEMNKIDEEIEKSQREALKQKLKGRKVFEIIRGEFGTRHDTFNDNQSMNYYLGEVQKPKIEPNFVINSTSDEITTRLVKPEVVTTSQQINLGIVLKTDPILNYLLDVQPKTTEKLNITQDKNLSNFPVIIGKHSEFQSNKTGVFNHDSTSLDHKQEAKFLKNKGTRNNKQANKLKGTDYRKERNIQQTIYDTKFGRIGIQKYIQNKGKSKFSNPSIMKPTENYAKLDPSSLNETTDSKNKNGKVNNLRLPKSKFSTKRQSIIGLRQSSKSSEYSPINILTKDTIKNKIYEFSKGTYKPLMIRNKRSLVKNIDDKDKDKCDQSIDFDSFNRPGIKNVINSWEIGKKSKHNEICRIIDSVQSYDEDKPNHIVKCQNIPSKSNLKEGYLLKDWGNESNISVIYPYTDKLDNPIKGKTINKKPNEITYNISESYFDKNENGQNVLYQVDLKITTRNYTLSDVKKNRLNCFINSPNFRTSPNVFIQYTPIYQSKTDFKYIPNKYNTIVAKSVHKKLIQEYKYVVINVSNIYYITVELKGDVLSNKNTNFKEKRSNKRNINLSLDIIHR